MTNKPTISSDGRIDLWDNKAVRERYGKLDPDQQHGAGLYKETWTLLSKYERRGNKDNLDKLWYAQFYREYDSYNQRKYER